MKKKTVFIIGFWIVFIILFIVSHKVLSKIILYYQQMPAIETNEAYQLISYYKQPVQDFYHRFRRCPSMADKKQIIPEVQAYTYVKTLRLLVDEQSKTCFIVSVMRDDTPSKDVKNQLITIAYKVDQKQGDNWACYTSINNIYTVAACRNNPLPDRFLKVLADYKRHLK